MRLAVTVGSVLTHRLSARSALNEYSLKPAYPKRPGRYAALKRHLDLTQQAEHGTSSVMVERVVDNKPRGVTMNEAGQESIRRVLTDGFYMHDISEPLVSFDDTTPASVAQAVMQCSDFDVSGVRHEGLVTGYVEQSALTTGVCGDHARPFEKTDVISSSATLTEVVQGLAVAPRLFVGVLGSVGGIGTKSDLEKPPVRMWLFGMVTLIEMRISRLIEQSCPDESWREFLSNARVQKAQELLLERRRRNQCVALLDCIQFSDKGQIMARNEQIRRKTMFESRRRVEQVFKGLERLRNNLAHSQDITTSDWEIIVQLTENLERVIEGPPGLVD